MSVIIRLQNLPWSATSIDIRHYFKGLSIPEGGVHIVGGQLGDAFIVFSTDEDARQAMLLNGGMLKEECVTLLLSSRLEMQKVIEMARNPLAQVIEPPKPEPVKSIPAESEPRDLDRRDKGSRPSRDRDYANRDRRDRSRSRSRSKTSRSKRDTDRRRSEKSSSRRDGDSRRHSPENRRNESKGKNKESASDRSRSSRIVYNESKNDWDNNSKSGWSAKSSMNENLYGSTAGGHLNMNQKNDNNQQWPVDQRMINERENNAFNQDNSELQIISQRPSVAPEPKHKVNQTKSKPQNASYIQVRGLPTSANHVDIKDFFRGISIPADGVQFVTGDTLRGKTTGTAYIKFGSSKDQGEALRRHKKTLGRNVIEVYVATEKDYLNISGESHTKDSLKKKEIESSVVLLKGLPYQCKNSDISNFFQDLPIKNIQLQIERDGQVVGEAFVEFVSISAAKLAVNNNKTKMGHRVIEVVSVPKESVPINKPKQVDNPKEKIGKPFSILMQGLPFNASDRDIAEFFSQNGRAPQAIYILLTGNGMATGEAFAEFNRQSDAEESLSKSNSYMGLRQILLKPVTYREMQEVLSSTRHIISAMEFLKTPEFGNNDQDQDQRQNRENSSREQIDNVRSDNVHRGPVDNQRSNIPPLMSFSPDMNSPNRRDFPLRNNRSSDEHAQMQIEDNMITDMNNREPNNFDNRMNQRNNQVSPHMENNSRNQSARDYFSPHDQMRATRWNNSVQDDILNAGDLMDHQQMNQIPNEVDQHDIQNQPQNSRRPMERWDDQQMHARSNEMNVNSRSFNQNMDDGRMSMKQRDLLDRWGPQQGLENRNKMNKPQRADMWNNQFEQNTREMRSEYSNRGERQQDHRSMNNMNSGPRMNRMEGLMDQMPNSMMSERAFDERNLPVNEIPSGRRSNMRQEQGMQNRNRVFQSQDFSNMGHSSQAMDMSMEHRNMNPQMDRLNKEDDRFGNDRPMDDLPMQSRRGPQDDFSRNERFRDGDRKQPLINDHPMRPSVPSSEGLQPASVDLFGKPGCVVGATNIPFRAGVNEILDFFGGFGISKESVIRRFNENGMATGDARIAFKTNGEAARSIKELNKRPIGGRPISLFLL